MRLLIVYHAGAMPQARCIFRAVSRLENVQLTAAVPEKIEIEPLYSPGGWLYSGDEGSCDGYRYVALPLRNPKECNEGFDSRRLRELIAETAPDIIHVLHEATSGYLFQIASERLRTYRSAKTLFYAFDNLPIRFRTVYSPLKWRSMWALLGGGAAANNEALDHIRCAGFPKRKPLERIFWGIAMDVFKPISRGAARLESGLDCEHVAGFVGRLVPEKGPAVFLDAVSLLPNSTHALVIGSGPMRSELAELVARKNLSHRVHFRDAMAVDSLVRYLNCMDVLAVPSLTTPKWKEQYGRIIAEAMACGVPVVGSDSGAIPEVIESAGLVVGENNALELAEAMKTVIHDKDIRNNLYASGLKRAQEHLSTEAMARNLLRLYARVLES